MKAGTVAVFWIIYCTFASIAGAQTADLRDQSAKSPGTATAWSLLGTITPVAISFPFAVGSDDNALKIPGALGLVVGPGMGHWYAKNGVQFRTGIILRGIGLGIFAIAANSLEIGPGAETDPLRDILVGTGIYFGGMIFLISAIHDIVTASGSADQYNRRHEHASISVSTKVVISEDGFRLGMAARF